MKKISYIFASLALLGSAALTGCEQDTQPRIEAPTEFVLNIPPMSSNVYVLNANSTVDLTWSQPNYGLGIVPTYSIEISKTEDFAEESSLELKTTYNAAHASIKGSDMAMDLQTLFGWAAEEEVPATPVSIYLRAKSRVPNYPKGDIISNVIPLSLISYFVSTGPDEIWLIGAPQGWNIASAPGWELYETEQGSKIYKGAFDIPEGQFQFRFYDKLGDWENNSIGAQDADEAVDISMASGSYSGPCFFDPATEKAGKGSWQDPDWAGGLVTITVDLNKMTVEFVAGAVADEIYIIGACNGWDINSDALKLVEQPAGSGVYTGTVNIPADQFTFRFYSELGDWEIHIIGSAEVDGDVDYAIPGLPYNGACVAGDGDAFKGKWHIDGWAGGDVTMTVNLNDLTVSFVAAE